MTMLSDEIAAPLAAAGLPPWPTIEDRISVVIPVLNAGPFLDRLLPALATQGLPHDRFLVIDSQSSDGSSEAFRRFGATVVSVERKTFNHGGTRQRAVEMRPDVEFTVMMTQDAIPRKADTIRKLLSVFTDPGIGMAYGRQDPRDGAGAIERHARLFNYPKRSEIRSMSDRDRLGIKTAFCSNSFAAYRNAALIGVGGFPNDVFFAEDQIVSGRMLLAGWAIAYCGDAVVSHSHDYSILEEFRRYFDVGVFHGRNRWLLESFGRAEGEGLRFMRSEAGYLLRHAPWQLPSAAARLAAKYLGYQLGKNETRLSPGWKARLSMQPSYWRARAEAVAPDAGSQA